MPPASPLPLLAAETVARMQTMKPDMKSVDVPGRGHAPLLNEPDSIAAIDAFLSGEPLPSVAIEQGYGRLLAHPYYDETVGTINAAMLVTRRMIEEQPDTVQRLVTAQARATETLRQDRDRWLGRAEEFGTPRRVLELAAGNMELAWRMDAAFVQRVKALGARMQELRLIERQPDYDQLINLRFVNRVDLAQAP